MSTPVGTNPTATYRYDVNRSLPVVLDDGTRKYVWGLGLAYAVDNGGNVEVYHTDGLGSVRGALGKLVAACRCKSGLAKVEQTGQEQVLQASRQRGV